MDFDQPAVVAVGADPERPELDPGEWPRSIPAVAQLLDEGLTLDPGVTLLVGENGSGKSTLVEGVAEAYGLSAEGGSVHSRHSTRQSESPLGSALRLRRGLGASRWGFFLRAETMHGWYTYLEDNPQPQDRPFREPVFHEMSHGESFLAVLRHRFDSPGLYCLDEPEAALSFSSTLALVGVLHDVAATGGQVLCATHSPLLAAMTGARLLELGEWGYRQRAWHELEIVGHWRAFLEEPQRYLRHVIDG